MAKRTAGAHTAAGSHLVSGGRVGATTWLAPHGESSAPGLHGFEETYAGGNASGRTGTAQLPGTVGAGRGGAGGVCGGVGIGARSDARGNEGCESGLGEPAARL